ncbi:hypothetical protein VCHENC02_4235B, partial [Vibrio harveyi]
RKVQFNATFLPHIFSGLYQHRLVCTHHSS